MKHPLALTLSAFLALSVPAHAQTRSDQTPTAQTPTGQTPPAQTAPDAGYQGPLVVHFNLGSAVVRPEDQALLDKASRLYRDAHPIAMILTGGTDTVGSPETNLRMAQNRTAAVLRGLVARGIPAERFQLLAKGETDLAVPTGPNVIEPQNRRVEIRWR